MRKTVPICLLTVILLSTSRIVPADDSTALSGPAQSAPTDSGTTTGQRIGNILSAVVTTAFPAVKNILDAIWPNRTAKPNETKKASDGQKALDPLKDKSDATQKANINDMLAAASNLAVARTFITNCADVSARVSAMQVWLATRNPSEKPTDTEKQTLHDIWDPGKKRLDALQSDATGKAIDGIKNDDFLKSKLQAIRDVTTDVGDNVGKQIDQGRFDALRTSLGQLAPHVDGVAPLAGILIGDLSSSLSAAANNLAASAGTVEDPQADKDRTDNLKLLEKLYPPHSPH